MRPASPARGPSTELAAKLSVITSSIALIAAFIAVIVDLLYPHSSVPSLLADSAVPLLAAGLVLLLVARLKSHASTVSSRYYHAAIKLHSSLLVVLVVGTAMVLVLLGAIHQSR